ncbi:MAG: hypothetical protein QF752_11720 [Planctomycetota bacterium]|nr:hypothetical protein [Planctomycetota bacterium]
MRWINLSLGKCLAVAILSSGWVHADLKSQPILPEYQIEDAQEWKAKGKILDGLRAKGLKPATTSSILNDLNRKGSRVSWLWGIRRLQWGFRWNWGDLKTKDWYPQGLTGSADATSRGRWKNRKVLLVSWYYHHETQTASANKGVRVSFVDITNKNKVRYRHVLLVNPTGSAQKPNFTTLSHPSGSKYAALHAGGIVCYGPYLYVSDTVQGFRVFDLRRMFRVSTGQKRIGLWKGHYYAYGYKYILPQVGLYRLTNRDKTKFSFVGLDRSQTPHALISGEYQKISKSGLIYRWNLNSRTYKLDSTQPVKVFKTGVARMQGALSKGNRYWTNTSGPIARMRYLQEGQRTRSYRWRYGPEDLMLERGSDHLWALSEHPWRRQVWCVKTSDYSP